MKAYTIIQGINYSRFIRVRIFHHFQKKCNKYILIITSLSQILTISKQKQVIFVTFTSPQPMFFEINFL